MIVCGTDFSKNADQAVHAAAVLAGRFKARLKLIHVFDQFGAEVRAAFDQNTIYDPLRNRLKDQAGAIAARFGVDVEPVAVAGVAYEKLVEIATADNARMIVLSSLGGKAQHRWFIGNVAERVAQTSPVPVLIIRESASIESWAGGSRPLRVMVGVEMASTSEAALHWAANLRTIGACDLLITQVAAPFEEHFRFGIPNPMPLDRFRPELRDFLVRDLRAWAGDIPGDGETRFNVTPGWGRVDAHLALLAAEKGADLLVVGTHQRAGSAYFWQGSVSRGVLHHASCNVVCVPKTETLPGEQPLATFRRVLISTDFSPLANRAIPVGYGLVTAGGIVHLLHVVTKEAGDESTDATERLRGLIPKGAAAKNVLTEVEVVQEDNASIGIWRSAARLGVDAICMATHGRSGLSRIVLGSEAMEVVQRARHPVILVPPERNE